MGKHTSTKVHMHFPGHWARKLSWKETTARSSRIASAASKTAAPFASSSSSGPTKSTATPACLTHARDGALWRDPDGFGPSAGGTRCCLPSTSRPLRWAPAQTVAVAFRGLDQQTVPSDEKTMEDSHSTLLPGALKCFTRAGRWMFQFLGDAGNGLDAKLVLCADLLQELHLCSPLQCVTPLRPTARTCPIDCLIGACLRRA